MHKKEAVLFLVSSFFFLGIMLFMTSNLSMTGAFLGAKAQDTAISLTLISTAGIILTFLSVQK